MKEQVTILVAGLMETGFAQVFSLARHRTVLFDTSPEAQDIFLESKS